MHKLNISLVLILLSLLPACKYDETKDSVKLNSYSGKKFYLKDIVDTSGQKVELDFSKTDLTLIDFWNNSCPPCINEMKQFPGLLKDKANKISIVSISLTQFYIWQQTLKEHKDAFYFLGSSTPGWTQYNLLTKENPKLKNEFSIDRHTELDSLYKIKGYPAYFVVNKNGEIVLRPESAVTFLKNLN
ncbi:MAG: redoxin domain-containing protein [Bacteroidota bacterium]